MVIWSNTAKSDLRAIHDFIAYDSKHYAKMVTQDIVAKAEVLADLRQIGRVVPELGDDTIREVSQYSYRIIYQVSQQDIHILAVIHKRRELRADMVGQP